ncbi:MAG: hypothetical protein HY023_18640, partial [Chloroflexi bacterium]|nr:hypothetical protein [Chloroflexota bacterium]
MESFVKGEGVGIIRVWQATGDEQSGGDPVGRMLSNRFKNNLKALVVDDTYEAAEVLKVLLE